jgi:AraC-like DNA-binding protein
VLPDGCPELIVHLGDPFDLLPASGHAQRQARVLFAGQLESRLLLRPAGHVAVIGIRFHPYGAAALLHEPQQRLVGDPIALAAIAPRLDRALDGVDLDGQPCEAAASAIETLLERWLDRTRIDTRVAHAVALLQRSGGSLGIDRVARSAEVSPRQLERLFLDSVGLTPKRFASVTRFRRALRELDRNRGTRPIAQVAAASGYADHSHLVRDFQRFAGCAPSIYLAGGAGAIVSEA